ncbi:MAG: hypothetical protein LBI12_00990 [Treponema sp.]|nr:hypothetical protein [Treponema sp.]
MKFKDEAGNYLPPVSTKKNSRDEAMQVAFKWLRDGIPQKKKSLKLTDLSMKNMVRKIETDIEAELIMTELKRMGWVKGFIAKDTPAAEDFISFLINFWEWETSPYIEEKLRQSHGIHKRHCKLQKQAITLHWEPFY